MKFGFQLIKGIAQNLVREKSNATKPKWKFEESMESGERQEQIIKIYLWATCSQITSSYWRWVLSWRTPANPHLCLSLLFLLDAMWTNRWWRRIWYLVLFSLSGLINYSISFKLQPLNGSFSFSLFPLSLHYPQKEKKTEKRIQKKHPTLFCLCFVHFTQFSIQRMEKNESFQRPIQ